MVLIPLIFSFAELILLNLVLKLSDLYFMKIRSDSHADFALSTGVVFSFHSFLRSSLTAFDPSLSFWLEIINKKKF